MAVNPPKQESSFSCLHAFHALPRCTLKSLTQKSPALTPPTGPSSTQGPPEFGATSSVPAPPLQCPHSISGPVFLFFSQLPLRTCCCAHTPALLARGPANTAALAGWKLSDSLGPRLLGTQPVHEHSGQVTQGQVGQERTGQQAALLSAANLGGPGHVDHPCWTQLDLQLVVFRCSCAVRVTDHREERNHRANSECAQGLPCAVLFSKHFLPPPFSPTPIKKKGRDQVLGTSWMLISI